ncbi:MAG: hypothetical protein LBO08_03195 [Rickettsiales bacterium]|nr:hypothetical protein [Rickettsiales bacterium]
MKRIICALFVPLVYFTLIPAFAENDCSEFKISPEINMTAPQYSEKIERGDLSGDVMHGNIQASYIEKFGLSAASAPFGDGFCVVLRGLDIELGYTDFLIKIDKSHEPGSCEYNMVLKHEQEHRTVYLSVLDGKKAEIKKTLASAADMIAPAYVARFDDINGALDKMQRDLQENPNIILIKQTIDADTEVANKKIDTRGDSLRMLKCK